MYMHFLIAVYTLAVFMSSCQNCVMYVRQFSVLQLLIWASYRHFIHFKERLPEAICCCLQTCNVDVVLVVMYCMYIPAFIVNSTQIALYYNVWPEAIFQCETESKGLTNFLV